MEAERRQRKREEESMEKVDQLMEEAAYSAHVQLNNLQEQVVNHF